MSLQLLFGGRKRLGPARLASSTAPQNAMPGQSVTPLQGLTAGSARTLLADAGGRLALSASGTRLVAGLVPTVVADGPLSVTLRETLGNQVKDTVLSLTVPGYQAETTALLAAMTAQPSAPIAAAYDRFVVAMKAAGLWAALDVLFMPCHDSQASRLNWKAPASFAASIVGTVDFLAFKGHKSDGSTGYLTSGFNPATNGVQFTANSATMGWHCYPDLTAGVPISVSDTNFDVGTGGNLRGQARAGGAIAGRMNSVNSVVGGTVPTPLGVTLLMRRDVNTVASNKDGAAFATTANVGDGTLNSLSLKWCGGVVAGNYSSRRVGVVFMGRAFTDAEAATCKTILETYFREVGTWGDENTRGPGLYSSDAAAYGSMSSQVIPDVAVVGTRRFRANYGVHGQPAGTSGEGAGAYVRINYSDDAGATYSFGGAFVPNTPASESLIDPHILGLADGRLLVVAPYNGSGGQRSVWAWVLTNPLAAPAAWVWTAPAFLGFGFVGSVYPDGPDLMFTLNQPMLGQTGDGDYFCRLSFNAGLPVARVVSLMPNAQPSATLNDYGERILARRPDGSLFVGFRTQSQNYWYSTSDRQSDGAAWTPPAAWTVVPNPSARMATALSPNGNRYLAGNNSSTSRSAMTLWQLAPDMMSVTRSLLLDARGVGSNVARVSYPGIAFRGSGGAVDIYCDWDCGRGIQDPPTYTNELLAAVVPEAAFLAGGTGKTIYTVTS